MMTFFDLPSLIIVILGTLILSGIMYKKNQSILENLKKVKKNCLIMGISTAILSIFLYLKEGMSIYENSTAYLAVGMLPIIYSGLIYITIEVIIEFFVEKLNVGEEKNLLVEDAKENQQRQMTLSKRELEIYELIMEGLNNKEIGSRLYISENTVKKHIGNIFLKFEVKSRIELITKQNQQ